jgi:hypothetical protein
MNAVVKLEPQGGALAVAQGRMAVSDIIQHVAVVQEVMRAVMKPEVHYGKIPGTDKPTLYKAGAEVLCMVFRIADTYEVTDMSTEGIVRYRVNCIGVHQGSGTVMGSGLGEASSGEEKYKWRKAICKEEFDETPANMRRVKHARGKGGTTYKQDQIRTEPADLANTILKMANKRAKMAMVLNVTAASDCFAQDLEDMDDALRDHLTRHGDEPNTAQGQTTTPAEKPVYSDDAFQKNLPIWRGLIESGKKTAEAVIKNVNLLNVMTEEQMAMVRATVVKQPEGASNENA